EVLQQPLDVIELELRAEALAEAAAQLLENAPSALHIDLARHFHCHVVAVVTSTQWPAERVRLLVGARLPEPSGLTAGARAHHALLLHLLGEVLRPAAQR